jgi:hypothetical protein
MYRNIEFSKAYMSLSRFGKLNIKVRDRIINETGSSLPSFYNWVRGATEVPKLAKPIIAKIMNIPMETLFPEEVFEYEKNENLT